MRFEDQDRASSVVMPGFKPESDESKETHQVLSLLEELHNIISGASSSDMNLESDVQWVNEALSDQLRSQLSEPLSIATRVFPSWTGRMPKRFPFLFRDADRVAFLRCTSLGVSRAVAWLQDEVGRPFHLFFSRIVLKQERERERESDKIFATFEKYRSLDIKPRKRNLRRLPAKFLKSFFNPSLMRPVLSAYSKYPISLKMKFGRLSKTNALVVSDKIWSRWIALISFEMRLCLWIAMRYFFFFFGFCCVK